MDRRVWVRGLLIALLTMVWIAPIAAHAMPVAAAPLHGPAGVGIALGDPHPGPAVPFIGGLISNADGMPICGAEALLLQVDLSGTIGVRQATTGADGHYAFNTDGLSASAVYIVAVPTVGVLLGRVPTLGTQDPSLGILGSVGNAHVDMAFQ